MAPHHLLDRALALLPRQDIVAIPNTYKDNSTSPPPGTVVGIVIGSVAGFLLVLWLIATCFGFRVPMTYGSDVESSIVSRHRHRSSSHSHSRRHSTGGRR